MTDLEALILSIFIFIVSFIAGILFGLSITDKSIQNKLCEQLYTNTTNYLNCKSDHDTYKYIERVQPIK